MFIATYIADQTFDASMLSDVAFKFDGDSTAGRLVSGEWLDEGRAFDLTFEPGEGFLPSDCAALADRLKDDARSIAKGGYGHDLSLDVIVQPAANRAKRLLVADMDSTMITVECIDELADYAGIKDQVAEVTERAMRGELDFAAALDARVALLAGLDEAVIAQCLAERVVLMAGARTLVQTMKARGGHAILVSGGFTRFAEPVAAQIGFDRAIANVLEIADGKLTGTAATAAKTSFTIPGGKLAALDLSGVTQLAGDYTLTGTADGKAPSAVTGTEFGADGTVYATYADGTRLAAFKVPLADVKSPDNMDPRAGNVFQTTIGSGDIQIGFAGTGGLGTLKSSALEQSNVDVSTELTTMIESQTVYTANSKVFMTGNELLDTLMNLKR